MTIHCCIKQLLLQRLDFLFRELQEEASKSLEALEKCNAWAAIRNENGESHRHDGRILYDEARAAVSRHRQIGQRRRHLCNAMNQLWLEDGSCRFSLTFAAMTSSIRASSSNPALLNLSSLSVWLDEQSHNLGIDFAFGQDKMKQIYRDMIGKNLLKRIAKREVGDQFRMTPQISEEKCQQVSATVESRGGIGKDVLSWCMRYEPIFRAKVENEDFPSRDIRLNDIDLRGRIENEDTLRVVLWAFLDKETFDAVIEEFSCAGERKEENKNDDCDLSESFDESKILEALSTAKSDWRWRTKCLNQLSRHLADKSAVDDAEFGRVTAKMKDGICLQIGDLRSALSKTASECCATICQSRPRSFLPHFRQLLDALFCQVHVATKPTSEAAKAAVIDIVICLLFNDELGVCDTMDECQSSPGQSLMSYLMNIQQTSKHEKQRAHVCTILGRAFGKMKERNHEKKDQENVPPNVDDAEEESEDVDMTDVSIKSRDWVRSALDILKQSFDDPKPFVKQEAMSALVLVHGVSETMARELYDRLRSNQKKKFDEIVHGKKSRRAKSATSRSDIRKWKRAQITKAKSATNIG